MGEWRSEAKLKRASVTRVQNALETLENQRSVTFRYVVGKIVTMSVPCVTEFMNAPFHPQKTLRKLAMLIVPFVCVGSRNHDTARPRGRQQLLGYRS